MPSRFWRRASLIVLALALSPSGGSHPVLAASPGEPGAAISEPAVRVENGPVPGSLEIRVNGTAEVSSTLLVEQQQDDGSFAAVQDLDLGAMKLVTSCDQGVGACIRLESPGLRPLPWSGMSCSAQCNRTCDKNISLHGRFRFVVTSCDGQIRYEGPVFDRPDTQD